MSAPNWNTDGRDWPHRDNSMFVAAGGVKWHVQVMGEAGTPVVLLLHGTGAASHSWRDVAPLLARDFTVVIPDLPGHGFSSPLLRLSLPAVAGALAALMDRLGLEPALTVGHSAGAAIALTMATRAAAPRAIVSLGGAILPFPGVAGSLFPTLAKWIFVNPFVPQLVAARARGEGEVAAYMKRVSGSTIDAYGTSLYARLFATSGHVRGALALMAGWDLAALERELDKVTAPVLLLHGEHDRTIPAKTAPKVAGRLADARFEILPGLGHLAHEEDPAGHAARIRAFAVATGVLAAGT
ncbi:alpha/beta hydrolase [alpha proteobacterium AAP81b]|nr:alpha/beta hydrolase [alpha proteobacterium AAP81b]